MSVCVCACVCVCVGRIARWLGRQPGKRMVPGSIPGVATFALLLSP